MQTTPYRLPQDLLDQADALRVPGQPRIGVIIEAIRLGLPLVRAARAPESTAPARVWARFVYPKMREVGPWFSSPGYISGPAPWQWVQYAGSGGRPGTNRQLTTAGNPTPAEVAECERWLAGEADRIANTNPETRP